MTSKSLFLYISIYKPCGIHSVDEIEIIIDPRVLIFYLRIRISIDDTRLRL